MACSAANPSTSVLKVGAPGVWSLTSHSPPSPVRSQVQGERRINDLLGCMRPNSQDSRPPLSVAQRQDRGQPMRSEKAKMLAGELYDPLDPELVRERERARNLCQDLNATREADQE